MPEALPRKRPQVWRCVTGAARCAIRQGTPLPAFKPEEIQMTTTAAAAPVVKKARRKWPWVLGGIVGLVLIIGVANSGTHSTANATPDEKLAVALAGLLGDSNRNIPRISRAMVDTDGTVEVHWSINDNLTPSLIRDGARQDVVNIVAVVTQTIGVSKQLIIVGDFAVPDGYGHTLERPVVAATYSARTLAKIGPGGIRSDRILRVADSTEVDAAFQ